MVVEIVGIRRKTQGLASVVFALSNLSERIFTPPSIYFSIFWFFFPGREVFP
jgi:hypothetical protein